MDQQAALNISWRTIFKLSVAIVSLYVLFLIKDIIIWFVFAFILGILFNFLIDILEKKRIPRVVAVIVLYLGVFALLSFFIYKTAPLILSEFKEFSGNLPQYLQRVSPIFEKFGVEAFKNMDVFTETVQVNIEKASGNIINALFSIFGGVSSTVLVITLAFFISLEKDFVKRLLNVLSPPRYKEYLLKLWGRAKRKVSGWFITRIIGAVFVGSAGWLILSIFNVKYSFTLGLLAGILDLVPIIGPLIAGFFATVIVALNSPLQALFVATGFIAVQQIENSLLLPVLSKKFIGLPPVLVLVAFAVGGKLWGLAGAILAMPLAGVLFEIFKDYLARTKIEVSQG